jgi:hypothetical protein
MSMQAVAEIAISKSKFTAGMQCLKRLYFQAHDPEINENVDGADDLRLEQGREVGLLARAPKWICNHHVFVGQQKAKTIAPQTPFPAKPSSDGRKKMQAHVED